MKPKNLRELIIQMNAEMSTACNRPATTGELLMIAEMVLKEIEQIKPSNPLPPNTTGI